MGSEEIAYVVEVYRDEERSLRQGIMYAYGDKRHADYLRANLNPHLTELVYTSYLNSDHEIMFTELAREEENL